MSIVLYSSTIGTETPNIWGVAHDLPRPSVIFGNNWGVERGLGRSAVVRGDNNGWGVDRSLASAMTIDANSAVFNGLTSRPSYMPKARVGYDRPTTTTIGDGRIFIGSVADNHRSSWVIAGGLISVKWVARDGSSSYAVYDVMTEQAWLMLRQGAPGAAVTGKDFGGRRHTIAVRSRLGVFAAPALDREFWRAGVYRYEVSTRGRGTGRAERGTKHSATGDTEFIQDLAEAVLGQVYSRGAKNF